MAGPFDALRRAARQRWSGWWQQRHPRADQIELGQRNIYIVPTGAGAAFAGLLALLLVASINYQLNLGYLLTFVLAGAGLSSMVATHATLRGLRLQLAPVEPAFAGDNVPVGITLQQAAGPRLRPRARHGIGLWWHGAGAPQAVWADVPAGGVTPVHLALNLPRRGWHAVPAIRIETRFPFGLFKAWSYWRPAAHVLAWPAPEQPMAPLPWRAASEGDTLPVRGAGHDEPDGVRAWRRGDALAQVLWKRSAQSLASGGELITRDRAATASARLALQWHATPGTHAENRLARLAAWVLGAERAALPYALDLPGAQVPTGLGPAQQRRCLDALAAWNSPRPEGPA